MMKIFIANPSKTIVSSTDHDYVNKCFIRMDEYHKMEFRINHNLITRIHRDSVYIKNRIIDKMSPTSGKLNANPYDDVFYINSPADCDITFSYGGFPMQILHSRIKPIVCIQNYAFGGRMEYREWKAYLEKSRKFYVERADVLVTPSMESLDCFKMIFPRYEDKIHLIPYFLPYLKAIEPEKLKEKYFSIEKIRLLFVGKEAKRKGLDNFIEAYVQLPTEIRDRFEVTVISKFIDGHLSMPEEFIHKVYVENIEEEFRKAHILVFLTKQEAYGLVLVEAMASGCAILTTDHPIQRSILSNAGGWFVNPFDIDAIGNELIEIANSTEHHFYEMGMANVNNFNEDKSPKQVSQKYFDLFSTLI